VTGTHHSVPPVSATPATLPIVDDSNAPVVAGARGRVLAQVYDQISPDAYEGPGDAVYAIADLLHAAIEDGRHPGDVFRAAMMHTPEERHGLDGGARASTYHSVRIRPADPTQPVSKSGPNDLVAEVMRHDEVVTTTEHRATGTGRRRDVGTYHDPEGVPGGALGVVAGKLWDLIDDGDL
jgi:hypothetical protein